VESKTGVPQFCICRWNEGVFDIRARAVELEAYQKLDLVRINATSVRDGPIAHQSHENNITEGIERRLHASVQLSAHTMRLFLELPRALTLGLTNWEHDE
jgi:hypothetical protein